MAGDVRGWMACECFAGARSLSRKNTLATGKVWCLHSNAQGSQTLRTIMARSVAVVFTTQKVGLACCSLAEMLSVVGVAGVALLVAILVSHSCLLSLCRVYAIKC